MSVVGRGLWRIFTYTLYNNMLQPAPNVQLFCCSLLSQIESELLGCFPGDGGHRRLHQYYDDEFPPNKESLGEPTCISEIQPTEWKASISANPDIRLYNYIQGPSLNDVRRGQLSDGWLLSAISMLSVASHANGDPLVGGSGGEHELQHIPSLFISHMGSDGKLITESDGENSSFKQKKAKYIFFVFALCFIIHGLSVQFSSALTPVCYTCLSYIN